MNNEKYFQKTFLEGLKLPELRFLSLFFKKNENSLLTQIIEEKKSKL